MEQWIDINGWSGIYEVSTLGIVRRTACNIRHQGRIKPMPPRVVKGVIDKRPTGGYIRVYLCRGGQEHRYMVHCLVMSSFVGPKKPGFEVNHKNGVRHDNRLENLEYVTRSDNQRHASIINPQRNVGSKHAGCKINEKIVKEILYLCKNGYTQKQIAKKFNVSVPTVSMIKCGRTWTHVDRS